MKRKLALLLILVLGLLAILPGCGNNADLNADKSPLGGDLDAAGDAYVGEELKPIEESELDGAQRDPAQDAESYEDYEASVK